MTQRSPALSLPSCSFIFAFGVPSTSPVTNAMAMIGSIKWLMLEECSNRGISIAVALEDHRLALTLVEADFGVFSRICGSLPAPVAEAVLSHARIQRRYAADR